VEILWDARVDATSAALYVCKVSRTVGFALDAAPADRMLPAQADRASVFDNSVERASRERAVSGISLKRSHKIDYALRTESNFRKRLTWSSSHPFERWR
jgi:hypothetical protein